MPITQHHHHQNILCCNPLLNDATVANIGDIPGSHWANIAQERVAHIHFRVMMGPCGMGRQADNEPHTQHHNQML